MMYLIKIKFGKLKSYSWKKGSCEDQDKRRCIKMKCLLTAIISVLLLLSLNGCGEKKTENISRGRDSIPPPKTTTVKFIQKQLYKSYNDCKRGEPNCTYIRLIYIEAVEANVSSKINNIINNELVTAYDMPDKNLNNIELMAETFIKDYEKFKKRYPQLPETWAIDCAARVYGETGRILCISFYKTNFLGGTHPNENMIFRNINKETGDTISLTDIFGRGFEEKLNALIDKKYREMKKLKPGDNLSEKGGLLKNKITFTNNFAVNSDKGIEFYYNAYEIAPYAAGPIVVKLSEGDVTGILTGSSPLK